MSVWDHGFSDISITHFAFRFQVSDFRLQDPRSCGVKTVLMNFGFGNQGLGSKALQHKNHTHEFRVDGPRSDRIAIILMNLGFRV
jgi:hypothetical protein